MYDRLGKGHVLTKKAESDAFRVAEKTIQRDLDSIRDFLEIEQINQYLIYRPHAKSIQLSDGQRNFFKKRRNTSDSQNTD